jgi:hypothetical protein
MCCYVSRYVLVGPSWSCSQCSWIYNYMYNHCLSPLKLKPLSWRGVLCGCLVVCLFVFLFCNWLFVCLVGFLLLFFFVCFCFSSFWSSLEFLKKVYDSLLSLTHLHAIMIFFHFTIGSFHWVLRFFLANHTDHCLSLQIVHFLIPFGYFNFI